MLLNSEQIVLAIEKVILKTNCLSCRYEDATCLVTMGIGKYYSVGLDLEWMGTLSQNELTQFSNESQKLLCRILVFPLVTVAALNGKCLHVFL